MFSSLIKSGLVKVKKYTEGQYNGLSVLKYSKEVFFKNLWHTDPLLLECRGLVVDEYFNIVSYPFTKIFNLNENGTKLPDDQNLRVIRKVNGFMCNVTHDYTYGLLISTTGSLDSEYVDLARKHIEKLDLQLFQDMPTHSFIFEICDESDPHIVTERSGAYLIGARKKELGSSLENEIVLDHMAFRLGAMRPKHYVYSAEELKALVKDTTHEGFMVRGLFDDVTYCKIKSPHYLAKKALMRLSDKHVQSSWDNPDNIKQRIDEEFYDLVDYLTFNFTSNDWKDFSEQDRSKIIEYYFHVF